MLKGGLYWNATSELKATTMEVNLDFWAIGPLKWLLGIFLKDYKQLYLFF